MFSPFGHSILILNLDLFCPSRGLSAMSKRHSLVITSVWGHGEGAYYHLVSREAKDAAKHLTMPTAAPNGKELSSTRCQQRRGYETPGEWSAC